MNNFQEKNNLTPLLLKSYRGIFPFSIGTTSYIYPDKILPNVKKLAPYLDEIEILLFESDRESLPDKEEIKQLAAIADNFSISYNIHLPMDIYLGSEDLSARNYALDTIKQIVNLTSPLPCSTYTLHIESFSKDMEKWQYHSFKSMEKLAVSEIKPEKISVETLLYPFEWIEKIITDFPFSICMDTGHLMLQQIDPLAFFNKYIDRISIIHLHGVEKKRDHISLARLGGKRIETILNILKKFTGIVSIEVFSFDDLDSSLKLLDDCRDIVFFDNPAQL